MNEMDEESPKARVTDGGPWRGPDEEEWIRRINDGACAMTPEGAGGEWTVPWIEGLL